MMNSTLSGTPNRQRGVALFIGLVFLLIMSILVLASARSTLLQEKMAGNVRESNIAFQTAEDVIRQVEEQIAFAAETGTTGGLSSIPWTTSGLAIFDCSGSEILNEPVPNSWASPPGGSFSAPARAARYSLVQMSNVSGRSVACKPLEEEPLVGAGNRSSYYLIIAYAEGPAGRGNTVVSSTYYYEE